MTDNLCGSDHFPIILHNIRSVYQEPTEEQKLENADWLSF